MFDNISKSNPFNKPFETFKAASDTKINNSANKLFKDRKFSEEYKPVYYVSRILQSTSSLVSASTFFIAIYLILENRLGSLGAAAIGLIICTLIEVLKMFLWKICSKGIQKYNQVNAVLIGVLITMHIVSALGSIEGARRSSSLSAPHNDTFLKPIDVGSIKKVAIKSMESIDNMILKLTGNTRSKALKVLASLNEQKVRLTKQLETELKEAKAINEEALSRYNREQALNKIEIADRQKLNSYITVAAAASFEALFVLCSLFCTYFLFRAYVDFCAENSEGPRQTAAVTAASNGKKDYSAIDVETAKRAPIGFNKKDAGNLETCANPKCSKKFKKIVWNKKYCSEKCKISAWEQRNGRTLIPKKS